MSETKSVSHLNIVRVNTCTFNNPNTFTGGLTIDSYGRHTIALNAAIAAGAGDVTLIKSTTSSQSGVLKLGANDVFATSATLRLNGKGWSNINNFEYRNRTTVLDMNNFNATVAKLYINGLEQPAGTYSGVNSSGQDDSQDWIDGSGVLTVTGVINNFAQWVIDNPAIGSQNSFSSDPDNDGLTNGIEAYLGSDPTKTSSGLLMLQKSANQFTFSHPINANQIIDIAAEYEWSSGLNNYHQNGVDNGSGTSAVSTQSTAVNGVVTVSATFTGAIPNEVFFRLKVTQLTP